MQEDKSDKILKVVFIIMGISIAVFIVYTMII